MVSYSQRGAGRQASVPSPRAKHLLGQIWKSLAHKYVPCWGWSRAELPAAESPSERQTSVEGGAHASPSSAFLWEEEGGGQAALWTKLTNTYNFQEGLPFSQPTPLL